MPHQRVTRRRALLLAISGTLVSCSGCADLATHGEESTGLSPTPVSEDTDGPGDSKGTPVVSNRLRERIVQCEEKYIQSDLRDDESVVGGIDTIFIGAESRPRGEYLLIESTYAVNREGSGNEPDLHLDSKLTAAYLITEDEMYRTEDTGSDGGSVNWTIVDC